MPKYVWINLSLIFRKDGEYRDWFVVVCVSSGSFLWIVVTFSVLHFVGNFPVFNEKFNIKRIDLSMTVINSLSNLPDIQFSPTAVFTERDCGSFKRKLGLTFEKGNFGTWVFTGNWLSEIA